jgi:hypothetical protein
MDRLPCRQGEFDTILPVFPCHAVSARLDHGAVLVRKMQSPSAVAADDALEHTARGKGVISVRIRHAGLAGDEIPHVFPGDGILGQLGARKLSDSGQQVMFAK